MALYKLLILLEKNCSNAEKLPKKLPFYLKFNIFFYKKKTKNYFFIIILLFKTMNPSCEFLA